ncbi:tyrosine-type recombinase/integrase [Polluticoccus soli]|uniref:tyrosine-type recombinase/integrase n=1 Tax=Polluticoccus soli TaxID=3034150 RepID=UPI0023E31E1C|nr:tyrosine-type recombinase/integrase [Flavipsychrobacter sp. JY13-12]
MLSDRITDYIHYLRFEKRFSRHTLDSYQKDLEQFRDFALEQFSLDSATNISHFHIRSWLAALKDQKQSPRTINRKLSSLNSFYKFLLRQQAVEKNPVRQLHALKLPERLPSYMKEQETQHLLEELQFDEGFKGFTDRLICELFYQTGMRRQELLQLKEADIEWSLQQVRVLGKGNKERLIPVHPVLLDELTSYIAEKKIMGLPDDGHLLVLENGGPLYPVYIYRTVKKYLSIATTLQKKSPHVLRHTFATHLLNNGANIQAIKDLLGHSSLAATQVYTHNNIAKLKEIHKQNHPRG